MGIGCAEKGEEAEDGLARAQKFKHSKTYTEVEEVSPGRNLSRPVRKDCLRLGDDEFSEGVDYIMSLFEFPHVTLRGALAIGDRLAQWSECSLEQGCLGSNPHSTIYPGDLSKSNALSVPQSVFIC